MPYLVLGVRKSSDRLISVTRIAPDNSQRQRGNFGRLPYQPACLTTRRSKHAIRPPGLRCACLPCSTYSSSTPACAKRLAPFFSARLAPFSSARLAPSPDAPLTHFALPRGEKCRPGVRKSSDRLITVTRFAPVAAHEANAGQVNSMVTKPCRPSESNTCHASRAPPERYRKRLKSENTMVNRTLSTTQVTMGM